jgi:hypothetical protein
MKNMWCDVVKRVQQQIHAGATRNGHDNASSWLGWDGWVSVGQPSGPERIAETGATDEK